MCICSAESSDIFRFLTMKLGGGFLSPLVGDGLKWNFHKFLCDTNGHPVKRYGPGDNPLGILPDILRLLASDEEKGTSADEKREL